MIGMEELAMFEKYSNYFMESNTNVWGVMKGQDRKQESVFRGNGGCSGKGSVTLRIMLPVVGSGKTDA